MKVLYVKINFYASFNNNKSNGEFDSALTKISTTRFAKSSVQIKTLIKRDSITLATKHVTITTIFKYMPIHNSHLTLYTHRNPFSQMCVIGNTGICHELNRSTESQVLLRVHSISCVKAVCFLEGTLAQSDSAIQLALSTVPVGMLWFIFLT